MESDVEEARQQLAEIDDAMQASTVASLPPLAWWFLPGVAFMGPAMVGALTARDIDFMAGYSADQVSQVQLAWLLAGLIAIVTFVASIVQDRRRRQVRGKAPIQGGTTTVWNFLFTMSITLGCIVTTNLVRSIDNRLLLAACSYLWFLLVPGPLYRRHVRAMAAKTGLVP